MWFFFSVLSGALYTGESLLMRFLLRDQKDAWAFSFFYSIVGALISLPFMLADPKLPSSIEPWLLALLVGVLIVGHNLCIFKASNHLSVSLVGALSKLRLVWIFGLSIWLLHDPFNWQKLAGTLLVMIAGILIMRHFKQPRSLGAVYLVLLSTFFGAAIIILSKYLLQDFNVASLTFFASFLPAAILNFVLMPRASARTKQLFKSDWRIVLAACGLGAFANLTLNQALALHDATSVIVIGEAFLLIVLVGEHILLKEKESKWIKLACVSLAIAGAILIHLNS